MIPKKIHYCWLSNDPMPDIAKKCLNSWQKELTDYEIILWDLNKFDINSTQWTKEAFEVKKYAFVADYIRLYALYKEGGIYLDSDVEVIKSFNDFLNCESFIGFETSGDIEAAIIGSQKGAFWLEECLRYYQERHFINPNNNSFDTRPLPIILEEYFCKNIQLKNINKNKINIIDDIFFYPSEYFSPKNFHTKRIHITQNTISIHHFDGSWLHKKGYYRLKNIIHTLIIKLLGKNNHKKITNFIRFLRK